MCLIQKFQAFRRSEPLEQRSHEGAESRAKRGGCHKRPSEFENGGPRSEANQYHKFGSCDSIEWKNSIEIKKPAHPNPEDQNTQQVAHDSLHTIASRFVGGRLNLSAPGHYLFISKPASF